MSWSEALHNISSNYRFHSRVRGDLLPRLLYLTGYYLIFLIFRHGDRYRRPLVWLKRLGFSDILVDVTTPDGLRLAMDLHTAFDPLYAIAERKDYLLFDFAPKPGQTVLDVGANVGIYATLAARRVGSSGTVFAVEPHPRNCRLLRENIARNRLAQARVVEAAIDERSGRMKLYIHERSINHSLVRKTSRSIEVQVTTVDQLVREANLGRVDILKIDTEGNMVEVLRGASDTLRRLRPRIVMEYEPGEVARGLDALIESYGYDLTVSGGIGYAAPSPKSQNRLGPLSDPSLP